MERLSPVDAAWLHLDGPTHPMVVTAVLWFDGPLDRDRVRTLVNTRLIAAFPRFGQRVVERAGGPVWEAQPDLEVPLVFSTLPPGAGQGDLEAFVSEDVSQTLPAGLPPWRLHVLDGYQGGWALVARFHHCLADGFALASVLLSLADAPEAAAAPVHHALVRARGPFEVVRRAGQTLTALAKFLLAWPDPRTLLRGPLGVRKLAVWSPSWDLESVKEAAHARGVTVNDLTMAALAGALRRWMSERGATPRRVRAFVPVDLRPVGQPIPSTLGNRFGLVYLALPVDQADPEARLAATHRTMEAIKRSPEAVVALGIIATLGRLPAFLERIAAAVLGTKGSLIATNVPGPRQRVTLAGSPLVGMRFWVPQAARVSLGVSILSYAGEVGIGVLCDAGIEPDPRRLVAAFAAELEAFGARPVARNR